MNFKQLRRDLQRLRHEDGPIRELERVLADILGPLFRAEGLDLFGTDGKDWVVDLFAAPPLPPSAEKGFYPSVLIEYKHYETGRRVSVREIHTLMSKILENQVVRSHYERAMLISRFGFTYDALATAHNLEPVSLELLDLDGIAAWINRIETGRPVNAGRVQLLIRTISHEFAKLVASDPQILDHLEWRDLERMMARVMEGLGFQTILTPASKDGGKDLIVTCHAEKREESYIIELKHWRSGKRVGKQSVTDFVQVIVAEKRSGGLFLSTSGYAADAFEGLAEISRQKIHMGGRPKVVLLTQTYIRACNGLWSPPSPLPEVLFDATD